MGKKRFGDPQVSETALPEAAHQFFDFMGRREQLRIRKEAGEPWPWSGDEILNTYKFTNVKREDDRTTRWMREHWTGCHADRPGGEIIFNCALFRYFGTVEFAEAVGWQITFNPDHIIRVAEGRQREGLRVFTGAYIVPSLSIRRPKHEVVTRVILAGVWEHRNKLANLARETESWRVVTTALRELPGFGGTGFMAKEVLQDLMHTRVMGDAKDKNTWCPAGPGARRGLNRIWNRPIHHAITEKLAFEEMAALFAVAPLHLPSFMPELELHDIQFQLCEFDKYERARRGEGKPKARYHRPMMGN